MSEFIGVKKLSDWQECLSFKKDALIFDRIALSSISDFKRMVVEGAGRDQLGNIAKEFSWLLEKGVIFEPKFTVQDDEALRGNEQLESIRKLLAQHRRQREKLNFNRKGVFWNHWDIWNEYLARSLAIILRVSRKLDAYPISNLTGSPRNAPKNEIVTVVINALPMPSESTSWEQIIEYRSDPDSHSKFLALRNWMNDISQTNLTSIEVEQKLEYLIDQYQQHMKLHRIKTNTGTLETVLVTGSEIIEDLVRFKFSKVAKALFTVKHRKIALLEGELTAPGHELAYIIKARETFQSTS
ncbi:MAG TPA: hypothetical protein VIW80_02240 [Pyrinomonadaceae bacterium]|jgi:hypothetical protein